GGNDLYRAPFADGEAGTPQHLGAAVNTRGDERSPMPSRDGRRLLFSSDGRADAQRHDLYVAHWQGDALADVQPLRGINTDADETDAMWLADGHGLVFARSQDVATSPVQLFVARCRGGAYVDAAPLALAFNTGDARTLAPMPDWNRPVEMLLSGAAPSPKAGRLDVYRILVPTVQGDGSCG
ncbi:MAG TPA: TolB-like protein, partial [Lysobacter sp.]